MKIKGMVAVLLIFLTGCASIVGQSVFPVTINSNPSEAKITVTDEHGIQMFNGTTPTTVVLTAGESYFHAKSYTIKFSKFGFGDQITVVKADIDGWYFGNILFGGLIGLLIVDPITGKMWKLPAQAFGNLSALGATPAEAQPSPSPAGTPTQPKPGSPTHGNGGVMPGPKASLKKGTSVLQIASLDQVPKEMRKYLIRIN